MKTSEPNPRPGNDAGAEKDDRAQAGRPTPRADHTCTHADDWDTEWNIVRGED